MADEGKHGLALSAELVDWEEVEDGAEDVVDGAEEPVEPLEEVEAAAGGGLDVAADMTAGGGGGLAAAAAGGGGDGDATAPPPPPAARVREIFSYVTVDWPDALMPSNTSVPEEGAVIVSAASLLRAIFIPPAEA